MKKIFIVAVFSLFLCATAQANTLVLDGTVAGTGQIGSVDFQYFTTDIYDFVTVQTHTDAFDPVLYLFTDDGVLSSDDMIASDDDSGVSSGYGWRNALVSRNLNQGSYVVAVADYILTLDEVLAGINDSSDLGVGAGAYQLEISAAYATITPTTTAPVPEPATMVLLSLGLAGFAGYRKKNKN